jgi:site-specific recombinase XerD
VPLPVTQVALYLPFRADAVPAHLDGSTGTNRAPLNELQLSARNDVEAVIGWLMKYKESPNTFAAYRKEVERLLLWCHQERQKPLSSLTYEDLLLYKEFLSSPPAQYISARKYPHDHPGWRPFHGPLSVKAIGQAFAAIGALFHHLTDAGYLNRNPVRLMGAGRRGKGARVRRLLTAEMREILSAHIDAMPGAGHAALVRRARARWVIDLLLGTGLRISELLETPMGAFRADTKEEQGQYVERWWLDVVGKGQKERSVAVPAAVIQSLQHYRGLCGLPALPAPGETLPLVFTLRRPKGVMKGVKRAALHNYLKHLFHDVDLALAEQAHPLAGHFTQVSAHWLRHTSGSMMIERGASIGHARDQLGHSDISTTGQYVHTEDDQRHDAVVGAAGAG